MRLLLATALLCLVVTHTVAFDVEEATTHLLNAFASYCQPESLMKWDCYWCNDTMVSVVGTITNTTNDIFGFVGIDMDRDNIVVAFRGTKRTSIPNWIDNLDFIKTTPYSEFPTMEVHEGFWGSYISIKPQLLRTLALAVSLCPQCSSTVYTGHSLGAAISALAAVDINFNQLVYQPSPEIFNFGQPRVGNTDWAVFSSKVMNSTTRVIHNRDLVPHLPLSSMGFHHSPYEVWATDSPTTYTTCDSSGEDPKCADSIVLTSITDHFIYMGFDHRNGKPFMC